MIINVDEDIEKEIQSVLKRKGTKKKENKLNLLVKQRLVHYG